MSEQPDLSQRRVCRVLNVTRSTLWRQSTSPKPKGPKVINLNVAKDLKALAHEFPTFGYRRLWAMLRYRKGHTTLSKNAVHRLCKHFKLQVSTRVKTPRPRAAKRRSQTDQPNERWAIDATSIDCGADGLGHVIAIIDCHDRQIVGWHMAMRGRAKEAVITLEDACLNRFQLLFEGDSSKRPVLRSDNGKIFYSKSFQQACRDYGLRQEFITPYTPQQNGMIERFFRSLKEECVWLHRFEDFKHALTEVKAWMTFYNEERPHMALKYKSPNEFRALKEVA